MNETARIVFSPVYGRGFDLTMLMMVEELDQGGGDDPDLHLRIALEEGVGWGSIRAQKN